LPKKREVVLRMKKTIKKMIAGIALAATLATGNAARANGSVEVMAGHEKATIDLKVGTKLAPRTNVFFRGRTGMDYENKVDYFGLADLSINVVGGLDGVVETQFIPSVGVVPRAGAQYFGKFGDASVYGLGTVKLGEDPDAEFVLNLRYAPKVTEDTSIVLNAENVTNVGGQGHNFSVQRLRAGVGVGKYEAGAAADVNEAAGKVSYNVGGYVKAKF
jgi:hypothetical protein